jgi:hypothetical protein
MIFLAISSFAITLIIGYSVVSMLWPSYRTASQDILLKSCLAVGCGFGISSCCYFLWVLFAGSYKAPVWTFAAFEAMLLIVTSSILYIRRSEHVSPMNAPEIVVSSKWTKTDTFCVLLLTLITISAMASFILITRIYPHGQWDAWAIWNRSARFLFRGVPSFQGEAGWMDFFLHSLNMPNLDYPLLTPCAISGTWKFIGSELLAIPAVVAAIFTFATAGILFSSLSVLRSKTQGALAAIFLLGTTAYTLQGAAQYADIPLGLFIVSAMALFFLHDKIDDGKGRLLVLAGLMAGFAAWTKNEGILALIIIIITRAITVPIFKGAAGYIRELRLFGLGSIPGVLIMLFFKIRYAPPNAHISSASAHLPVNAQPVLEKLTDLSRYGIILGVYKKHVLEFGSIFNIGTFYLSAMWILLAYLIIAGIKIERKEVYSSIGTALFLAGLSMAYFFVYVTTHYDLAWLLSTSCSRLFIQLWPTAILLFFLIARDPTIK